LVALRDLLPGARRRRRTTPRPDGPKTIVPPRGATPPAEPAAKLDAARDRLRREIPPRGDDE
jgi:hypothetical protein